MKYQFYILVLTCSFSLAISKAQGQQDLSDLISRRAADSISKSAFGKMVAGTDDVTNLANYVSFVPTDGKFTLSGNYFFSVNNYLSKKRKTEYFAVGFNSSGSIVGGTVATLFESGTLNTGVDLGLKFSWRMNKPNIGSLGSETQEMIEKRKTLEIERDYKIDSIKNSLRLTLLKRKQVELNISDAKVKLDNASRDVVLLTDLISKCSSDTCRLRFTDLLIITNARIFNERQRINKLNRDISKLEEIYEVSQIDPTVKWEDRTEREQYLSRKYGLSRINLSYEDTVINKVKKVYDDKIYEVEIARPIAGMRLNWLSVIFNWDRVAYRTYYDSLRYENALTKLKTPGLTLGLQANFYSFYKPVRRASLLNIALLFKRTTNLEDLTSSKLTEEKIIASGSTTRKSSNEYTVYTDRVEIYTTIQLPINYYRFFGKDLNFGWHAFALADWRDTKDNLYDLGAGFIFGLNSTGGKRLYNVEIFAKYKDITRELVDEDKKGWKQFQFGLSVAIPFMTYKN
ncbi:hypothetical protein [Cellulophaga sp. BC115SP]|uniref:hypothetical protein n=1 Tax=Cellulophaga sp. BC115SP TaxID=2683263 RepID=UPI0014124681|nr:hypothetical protein [Cellulophaga sp. BC115SP]NBB31792.1 hypothetical protein [Cellulophaga sp. BC115SP]